jgi:nitrate/nitrite transporter NarK
MWGAICGKKTCRLAWTLSLVVCAVGCVIWSFAPASGSVPVYFIALALANIGGMGFAYIASLNVVSNWFPRKKGLAMGWVTIGFPLSAVIATPLCSALVGGLGLNGIYLMYAVLCVILAVLVWIVVRDYPEEKGAFPDNNPYFDKAGAEEELKAGLEYMKHSPWTTSKLLHTSTVWKMVISLGVMELLSLGIMTNFMPRMLQIGYQQMEVIPMLAVAGLVACVGSVLCGLLDAKVGPKKAIIITYIIAIISIVLNITAGKIMEGGNKGLATGLFYISLPFLAIMLGGAANYLVSLTNTIWGRYDFPAAYRLLKPLVAVVGAIGITICGGVGNSSAGYGVAYAILGVLAVIGLILIFTVDDTQVGRDM